MADIFSKRKRSEIMSRIRNSGGPTERVFRRAVRETYGGRPNVNDERLPGTPDVSIYKLRVAVFMDGCYRHGCPKHSRIPKSWDLGDKADTMLEGHGAGDPVEQAAKEVLNLAVDWVRFCRGKAERPRVEEVTITPMEGEKLLRRTNSEPRPTAESAPF